MGLIIIPDRARNGTISNSITRPMLMDEVEISMPLFLLGLLNGGLILTRRSSLLAELSNPKFNSNGVLSSSLTFTLSFHDEDLSIRNLLKVVDSY